MTRRPAPRPTRTSGARHPTTASIEAATARSPSPRPTVASQLRGSAAARSTTRRPPARARSAPSPSRPGFTGTQAYRRLARPAGSPRRASWSSPSTRSTSSNHPASRADQLQAALDYLVTRSTVAPGSIDRNRRRRRATRWAAAASIEAARDARRCRRRSPSSRGTRPRTGRVCGCPPMIQGAENDTVAPVAPARRAASTTASRPRPSKAYLEIDGASHLVVNSTQRHRRAKYTIVLAQALRRRRHPLRPVPVPPPERHRHPGVPRHLPARHVDASHHDGPAVVDDDRRAPDHHHDRAAGTHVPVVAVVVLVQLIQDG